MTTFGTLTPLFRQTVGFDRFNNLFESMLDNDAASVNIAYPPYNIEKHSENKYCINMVVAGFDVNDLNIINQDDILTISGKKEDRRENKIQYLYKGIETESFEHKFNLSDHMKVHGATLSNGILRIDLEREVPESSKPKMIKIRMTNGPGNKMLGQDKKS